MAEVNPDAVLVIALGNELRGDDGAGLAVARHVQERAAEVGIEVREFQGEPTALLDAWRARGAAIVTDTMRSGAAPGTIRRLDAGREPLRAQLPGSFSTHALGLEETIELARALDQLPGTLVVYAVEGGAFETGTGLSDEVRAAIPRLAEMILGEAGRLRET